MKGLIKKTYNQNIDQEKILSGTEIKKVSYAILLDVAEFCDKNGIRYFLACGTALGAIRHKGFIPWDDDIDIAMPRPDYEKFIKMYSSEGYIVREARFDKMYPYPFAKVCDYNTCLIEQIAHPIELGVYIDIFPIDGVPEDDRECRSHLNRIEWNHRLLGWKRISPKKKVGLIHKIIQIFAKVVLAPVPVSILVNCLEKRVKKYPYELSNRVGHFVTRSIWGTDVKEKSIFDNPVKWKFEDHEFWVPGDVDAYLTLEYGDYMKLPPKEKQVAKHDFVSYFR